ncbi:MAG: ATP-binding cassette domain-containing protein, partial [Spirochaetales bacterium]|nr:ATP-binding cassette domain-containing protein [Spirochaetales bacterium]
MIVLDNVSYSVEDDLIIKELTLSIKKGESIAVLGSNGCGKSTLAKLVDALIVPSIGSVKVSSFDTLKPKERRLIHREVGMVFQNPSSAFVGNTVR